MFLLFRIHTLGGAVILSLISFSVYPSMCGFCHLPFCCKYLRLQSCRRYFLGWNNFLVIAANVCQWNSWC